MKILPFLVVGAATLIFMGLAGQTYRHIQPKINRERFDAQQRRESIARGFDAARLDHERILQDSSN